MRSTVSFVVAGFIAAAAPAWAQSQPGPRIVVGGRVSGGVVAETRPPSARAYQGRNSGPEQTERFSRKVKIGRDGRVSLANIAGDIVVTGGSGDEVSIEAVKRTRGDRGELASVHIDVAERGSRVEVQTTHTLRRDRVSVDYTVSVPNSASLEVHSISGTIKVTGVRGTVRAETISGDVTVSDTPKLEAAKSTSGNVSIAGVSVEGDLVAGSVSGSVTARNVKAHGLELGSVSGGITVTDAMCDRLGAKSVSGSIEYAGTISKTGRYEINTHSGTVRLTLANPPGFELNANSFSGSVRSDFPMTIGGTADRNTRDRSGRRIMNNRSMRATYGDGSATLTIRTFSGDIVIAKK
ncbi:MAG: DUF4097 domain-containing protein [Acidobacteriia bacterium]|nr:DUF4097 domain-containing protein [Terriglobia bacterium]